MAVRAALGASVWRLARRQFAEVALVAGIAGVIGSWLASVAIRVLKPYAAQRLAFAGDIAVDWRAGAFVFALVTVVAAVVGLLPVLQTTRASLIARLRVGTATQAQGMAERRTRDVLATVQLALAISVLMGAGLLIQSLRRVSNVDLGYDPDVISFAISPPAHRYDEPAEAAALYKRIMDAVGAVPSVDGVAAAGGALLSTKVETEGQSGGVPPEALYHPVSERYLGVMKIRVTAGRGFTHEDMRTPAGFIITENLARKLWPGSSALGRRITVRRSSQARADFGQPITLPVIGVVADHRIFGPEADPQMQVFLPYTLEVWPWMTFAVRAPRTVAVAGQVERAIHDVEPAISYLGEKPHAARSGLAPLLTDPRVFVMGLMSVFGFVALLLAAIGLYGIIAYGVAQRTREIGLRLAVGATSRNVVALVMRRAMVLVGIGVVLGVLGGLTASRLVRSMLFETSVMDPATVALAPCLLAAVAAVASAMPAARAARIDPIVALRGD
jgi:putative ABC transport system permease protein